MRRLNYLDRPYWICDKRQMPDLPIFESPLLLLLCLFRPAQERRLIAGKNQIRDANLFDRRGALPTPPTLYLLRPALVQKGGDIKGEGGGS